MAEAGRGVSLRVLAFGLVSALAGTMAVHCAAAGDSKGIRPAPAASNRSSPPYHHVYVVCVGINDNPAYGNLEFAVADAEKLAEVCRTKYGFNNVTLLTDADATKDNV